MRGLLAIALVLVALPAAADDCRPSAKVQRQLRVQLERAVEAAVADSDAEITVGAINASQRSILCFATAVRSVEVLPGERPFGRVTTRAAFDMKASAPARHADGRAFVMAEVDVTVPVWVTARRIERGAPIDEYSLQRAMRPLAGLSASALRASEPVLGQVAKRTLSKNRVLVRSAMTSPTLVRRGETVSVTSTVGLVRVRARGEALGNGRVGDRINVRINRRRVVSGEVSARGEVVIR